MIRSSSFRSHKLVPALLLASAGVSLYSTASAQSPSVFFKVVDTSFNVVMLPA